MRSLFALCLAACGFHVGGTVTDDAAPSDASPVDVIDASNACLDGWCRRKPITIDGSRVAGGPHAAFPVLLQVPADSELAAGARADGFDLVVTAGDGVTRLPYERQRYANGQLLAWINVPMLAAGGSTTLYLYYGNPSATDQQDAAGTWTSGYRGVWHLDETAGGTNALRDATAFGNHATPVNTPVLGAVGMVGAAVTLDGVNDHLLIANSASLDVTSGAGTFSAWVKFADPSAGRFQSILSTGNAFVASPDGYSWATQPDGDLYFYPWVDPADVDFNVATNPFANQTWHHVAVTLAFATKSVKLYLDGVALQLATTGVTTAWTQQANPSTWLWGGNPDDAPNFFGGQLDELRVASAVRSADWLLTEYRNQSAPLTFARLGGEQRLD